MYGRIFESMFEGSMVGSGAATFAVWSYVIAKMREDATVGAQVDLNPVILATILGESQKDIEAVIRRLCAPDPGSRTKDEDGRRLIKVGTFSYQVVNGPKYLAIQNLEQKRAADRERKRKQRANVPRGRPLAGERAYEEALKRGDFDGAAAIAAAGLPMSISSSTNEEAKVNMSSNGPIAQPGDNGPIQQASTSSGAEQPIPEINSGPVYPVQEEEQPQAESGRYVDGEWVPD